MVTLQELRDGSLWNNPNTSGHYVACRVRASVRAFWPKDVRDFATQVGVETGAATRKKNTYAYRLGLQLASSRSSDGCVNVMLSNEDAEKFFDGIPAQDFRQSENRGAADQLSSRMRTLMRADAGNSGNEAVELEFAIKAYRHQLGKEAGVVEGNSVPRLCLFGTCLKC